MKIEYFRRGVKIGSASSTGALDAAIATAEAALLAHGADFFRVIDIDGSGAEVASGNRSRTDRY